MHEAHDRRGGAAIKSSGPRAKDDAVSPDGDRAYTRFMMRSAAVAIALTLVGLAGTARADAIDGQWCHLDGKRIEINGPRIRTPGGARIDGAYDRHAFSYVIPAAEPGAGGTVAMRLINDDVMHLRPPASGELQVWNRCGPPIS
jgi:hypothetical protein